MSSGLGWRTLIFFDSQPVPEQNFSDLKAGVVLSRARMNELQNVEIYDWCADNEDTFICERKGAVFRLGPQLQPYFWKSHQESLCAVALTSLYLVTVGEDGRGVAPQLKVWRRENSDPSPFCAKQVELPLTTASIPCLTGAQSASSTTPAHATALAVHDTLDATAVGFADGSVIVLLNDLLKDSGKSRWSRLRHGAPSDGEVVGLELVILPASRMVCFVICEHAVLSYVISLSASSSQRVVHNLKHGAPGSSRQCWSFDRSTNTLTVVSQDMVYWYEADRCVDEDGQRGRCQALDVPNKLQAVQMSGGHLVTLSRQKALIGNSPEATLLTVYDIRCQCMAFHSALPGSAVAFIWNNSLAFLHGNGEGDRSLSILHEKPLSVKLDLLYSKNLYDVALKLAQESSDSDQLAEIHSRYGDYLYSKSDFDNAVHHYIQTVSHREPSYVIQKFLDGSRVSHLIQFLESLLNHARRFPASAAAHSRNMTGHRNLLLNCYLKEHDTDKLKRFIDDMRRDRSAATGGGQPGDWMSIVRILHAHGMVPEAEQLAVEFDLIPDYIALLSTSALSGNADSASTALRLIESLKISTKAVLLARHSQWLLSTAPESTASMLAAVLAETGGVVTPSLLDSLCAACPHSEGFLPVLSALIASPQVDRAVIAKLRPLVMLVLEQRVRNWPSGGNSAAARQLVESLCGTSAADLALALKMAIMYQCEPMIEALLDGGGGGGHLHDLLLFYMERGQIDDVRTVCVRSCRPDIWLEALSWVASLSKVDEPAVKRLLDDLAAQQLVHPLAVVQILGSSSVLTVSVVQGFVANWLERSRRETEQQMQAVNKNRTEIAALQKQTDSLRFDAQVVQTSKCAACDMVLELPVVHCLCRHSFHRHCFDAYANTASDDCPACQGQQRQPPPSSSPLPSPATQHGSLSYDSFQKEISESSDVMRTLSDSVRMGLFDERSTGSSNHATRLPSISRRPPPPATQTSKNPFHVSSEPSSAKPSPSGGNGGKNPFDGEDDNPTPASTRPKVKESTNPFDYD